MDVLLFIVIVILAGVIILQRIKIEDRKKLEKAKKELQDSILRTSIEFQENEKKRIAGDLHDEIGSLLSTTKIHLNMACAEEVNGQKRESIEEIKKMLDEAINHVRNISRDLMPTTLDEFGVSAALQELSTRSSSPGHAQVIFEEMGEAFRFSKEQELGLYRIGQELLHNALKHSQADQIVIQLNWSQEQVGMVIRDNGVGFAYSDFINHSTYHKGLGINTIETRATSINAYVNFDSQKNKGTTISVGLNFD